MIQSYKQLFDTLSSGRRVLCLPTNKVLRFEDIPSELLDVYHNGEFKNEFGTLTMTDQGNISMGGKLVPLPVLVPIS